MNVRTCAAALLLVVGLPTAVLAADFPEIEPNESKLDADANGAFVLGEGDSVSGTTTGASTTIAGIGSADTFRIKTAPAAAGIYRHRMTLTTFGSEGHIGTIRGLTSSAGGPNLGTDAVVQTSSSTTTPSRMNQWYGFGREEELYYRVAGVAATTETYTATHTVEAITPTVFPSVIQIGDITIQHDAGTNTAYDRDMFLFDSNFNVISGIDDSDATALTASLTPGTYYIGYGRYNTAAGNSAGSGIIQGTFQVGNILDFTDIVASSSAANGATSVTLDITSASGTTTATGDVPSSYDVIWFSFEVGEPTSPVGQGTASPSTVPGDGTGVSTITVSVTPAANPTSSGITVSLDTSTVGGGTINMLDNGVAPDQIAGDNIFTANVAIADGWSPGTYTLPFAVTDAQARSSNGSVNLSVAPNLCPDGLSSLSFFGVSSDNALGGAGNSVVSGDFAIAGQINGLVLSGSYNSFGASYRSEMRIQATAPSGNSYLIPVGVGQPASAGLAEIVEYPFNFDALEDGTGTWTFEFFESFADGVSPDGTWDNVCFAVRLDATNPTGTGFAEPTLVINDGTGFTDLFVTVVPGAVPASTGLAVAVDASALSLGTITLLDNGTFPDQIAGDNVFSIRVNVPNGAFPGAAILPFTITDDQSRSGGGNINLTVVAPPPACPAGQATLSFTDVSSDGALNSGLNSVVTGDFGIAGQINTFTISGRVIQNTAFPYNAEARIAATAPSGNVYLIQPFVNNVESPRDLIDFTFTLPNVEDGTGTWTFEFYESFNDGVSPDATWQQICFAADITPTNPTATQAVTPAAVVRDGQQTITFRVTVNPGQVPLSTGITVIADDSTIGGSGSLALLDDGNFPDEVAGDNIFTAASTVAYTTNLGANAVPYTVNDSQGRSTGGTLNFTVNEASGACCTSSGCVVTTVGDCIDVQGGTFAGHGTGCFSPLPMTTEGAGAFEDISATGISPGLAGVDDGVVNITLPFAFNFFGTDYFDGNISSNANFQFGSNNSAAFTNTAIPTAAVPNNALYVLWDDHDMDVTGTVFTEHRGTPGVDERFIIQWTNLGQYNVGVTPGDSNTFQIVLFPDGNFEYRYQLVSPEWTVGDTTTIGFEDSTGTIAVTLNETRDTLAASAPISFRGNSQGQDTGVCDGGSGCAACAADYDQDGGVTGADIAAFFADFESGAPCADVDLDGGVTGADIGYFFFVFEQGGC
jgi:hypothetical protein